MELGAGTFGRGALLTVGAPGFGIALVGAGAPMGRGGIV